MVESVPIDSIPQLRPLQSMRILRDPYIARRSPKPSLLKVSLRFLSSLVSSAFCSLPPHRLLWFAFFLRSHYIPGSVSSTLHVSSRLSILSNKSLFRPHSCNLFCFFSPLGPPAHPAFLYAQLQLAQLHPVGLPFSLVFVHTYHPGR
jgi:hypothetical protein